jgi:RNase P/RNase MRP subunit p29
MESLIGKNAKVVESRNSSLQGIEGTVVDETKNMIVIRSPDKERMVEKKVCLFNFDGLKTQGKAVQGRAKDRIKRSKKVKKRW